MSPVPDGAGTAGPKRISVACSTLYFLDGWVGGEQNFLRCHQALARQALYVVQGAASENRKIVRQALENTQRGRNLPGTRVRVCRPDVAVSELDMRLEPVGVKREIGRGATPKPPKIYPKAAFRLLLFAFSALFAAKTSLTPQLLSITSSGNIRAGESGCGTMWAEVWYTAWAR